MANTDYRIDLLPALQTGLQLGQQRLARRDRQQAEAARLEQEALQLEAQKQAAQRRALIDAQTLKLNQDELTLRAQKYQTDEEIARAKLEQEQWNNLLKNTAIPKEPLASVTTYLPQGGQVTQRVPQSQVAGIVQNAPARPVKEELIDVDIVVSRDSEGRPKERVRRKMTKAEYDAYLAQQSAAAPQVTNAAPLNIIGTYDPKTKTFTRTTK